MAKDKISQYSTTNALNTDIGGIDIDENCLPSNLNDAIREVMVQLREFQNGTSADPLTIAGAFTASGTAQFTSTGAVTVAKGTTAERPASPQAGDFRFNTQTSEFEGFNGTAFASVGGAALSNDTATATDVFPLFASATSGTASSLSTSNAKLLYKPSTGEFKSQALVATNGIVVNSATIDEDYTIATGNNAHSVGPLVVNAVVTVSAGSVWHIS